MKEREPAYDEDDAKRILHRAAVLDAKLIGRLTEEEIRAAAEAAGISETAIAMALSEAQAKPFTATGTRVRVISPVGEQEDESRFGRLKKWGGRIVTGTLGLLSGATAVITVPVWAGRGMVEQQVLTAIAVTIGFSLIAAARLIKRDRFPTFLVLNTWLWGGIIAGFTLASARIPEQPALWGVTAWAITTLAASVMVSIRNYWVSSTTSKSSSDDGSIPLTGR